MSAGLRLGFLTVLEERRERFVQWVCRCDCGRIKTMRADNVRRRANPSCGCAHSHSTDNRHAPPSVAPVLFGDARLHAGFWRRVLVDPATGCWCWSGWTNSVGYGKTSNRGKSQYCHRLVVEFDRGPIPDKMQVDHLCRNTRCCNPAHLDVVTPGENIHRGLIGRAMGCVRHAQRLKTHCPSGHEYTVENTRATRAGAGMACRACDRERAARNRRKEKTP